MCKIHPSCDRRTSSQAADEAKCRSVPTITQDLRALSCSRVISHLYTFIGDRGDYLGTTCEIHRLTFNLSATGVANLEFHRRFIIHPELVRCPWLDATDLSLSLFRHAATTETASEELLTNSNSGSENDGIASINKAARKSVAATVRTLDIRPFILKHHAS